MTDLGGLKALMRAAERFLGVSLAAPQLLDGGDEALVVRADSEHGTMVVHASPRWRTRTELRWVHALVRHVNGAVTQAVAPIERDGETTFRWRGRCAAVFPFIAGEALDCGDPRQRSEAAELLGRIHRRLLEFDGGPRPPAGPSRPPSVRTPQAISDSGLDAWWASRRPTWVTGPTHGDYYRRNLICAEAHIAGVIDWHDATVRPLALELAGATFEHCRDDEHVLHFDRAEALVQSYRAAGGPVPQREIDLLRPLIRVWIKQDVLTSLSFGADPADEYVLKQIHAFTALR
jgi:Ser/Thr protein kinase RdoA (MazF antagonist)